jgi:hypothetical protein
MIVHIPSYQSALARKGRDTEETPWMGDDCRFHSLRGVLVDDDRGQVDECFCGELALGIEITEKSFIVF